MSERRCVICENLQSKCSCGCAFRPEPAASPDRSESAELEYCRRLMRLPFRSGGEYRAACETLLRMVGELTKDRDFMSENWAKLLKERDELRAQLAHSVDVIASERLQHEATEDELRADLRTTCETEAVVRKQRDELRAKLVEAEKAMTIEGNKRRTAERRAQDNREREERQKRRAEAAETRVRELETLCDAYYHQTRGIR